MKRLRVWGGEWRRRREYGGGRSRLLGERLAAHVKFKPGEAPLGTNYEFISRGPMSHSHP
eukprot:scaffold40263_cov31-Tisochrysis_lutea.AAC.1